MKVDEITYEWLKKIGGYSDHISHFQKLFVNHPPMNFLEFGLGYSTKYFLDQCQHVTSVEFTADGTEWIDKCQDLYRNYSNWTPITYVSKDIDQFIENQTHDQAFDIAFIDGGTAIRGRLVQLLFDKVPIIAAHDTYWRAWSILRQIPFEIPPFLLDHPQCDIYHYLKIAPPSHYKEIYIPTGRGTTFWIQKDHTLANILI